MPTYEYECPKCKKQFDIISRVCDYGKYVLECEECLRELVRVINTPPSVSIPAHMRATTSSKYYGKQARVPINLIDERPDGTVRVTRIGKKSDIENE